MMQTACYDKDLIYLEFHPKVLGYLRNRVNIVQDAEDLAQTVFLKVFSKLDTFDEAKSSISTWIFNITRNTLIDHQRAAGIRRTEEISEDLRDDAGDLLGDLILEEEQERLADALKKLAPEERDLILMHYYSGISLLDISKQMARPYGQIKRLHAKILAKLGQYMG